MSRGLVVLAALAVSASALAAEDWTSIAAYRHCLEAAEAAAGAAHSSPQRETSGLYLAMFSAANRVRPAYRAYLNQLPPASGNPDRAAGLAGLFFIETASGDPHATAGLRQAVESGLAPDEREPIERLAEAAARAAIKRIDEVTGPLPPYRPFAVAGVYVPTTIPATAGPEQVLRPFALRSADEVRPAGPPALDSERWAQAFNEVRVLGRKDGSTRTPEQTAEAMFWYGPDLALIREGLLAKRHLPLALQARISMLVEMAIDDADLANDEAKNHFQFWRPITAIRRAELDGREDTVPDPDWLPLMLTPNHPEYVCGHCVLAASFAQAMSTLVPLMEGETILVSDKKVAEVDTAHLARVGIDAKLIEGMSVRLASYDELVQRMSIARIYAGAHFRFSNEDGVAVGCAAANLVLNRVALPLR
jgi:hypothetical protein